MKDENGADSEGSPLGQLITMESWRVPETSVRRTVKGAIRHLMAQLRQGITPEEEPFQSLDDLPVLSEWQRERIAPYPDFFAQARTLVASLETLRTTGAFNRDVALIVAPPFSGLRESLVRLPTLEPSEAAPAPWRLVAPPEDLCMTQAQARQWWDEQDLSGDWVIPELGDFWLRHPAGLALIPELLSRMAAGETGQGIIGCSSWCWQFWSRYLPDAHLGPLTPAPLDAERLGRWFGNLAALRDHRPLVARMADDGLYVLPIDDPDDGVRRKHAGFLRDLAIASRGNPGVALAVWQHALRARPEESAEADDPTTEESGKYRECWVVHMDQLSLPTMLQSYDRAIGFILHALLLHDGLDQERLEMVSGVNGAPLQLALSRLVRADIIERGDASGHWRVTPLGYPTVRRHLLSWGYPVDDF
ncbi:MAG: hypothetical protein R3180_10795 [Marinobacter sp.]|nr:hypothetical protein [Marinobacter sp.]